MNQPSETAAMPLNDKKTINAWCSYDWSNSVYNLTITAAIFPVYYSATTREAFGGDMLNFFGLEIKNTVLYTYAISFSFLIIVFLSPILSGIADYSGRKKFFMRLFTYTGSLACLALYFFHGGNIEYGITCAVLASVGYAGALVFYNAFLPEIATPDRLDRVSAKGFSMGYIGSVILLVANLVLIMNYEAFGIASTGEATRLAFLQVGIWWFLFSHIAFKYLKDRPTGNKLSKKVIGKGFEELTEVLAQLRSRHVSIRFLTAFFFYSMGVQTVMLLAPLFAEAEINMQSDKLIMVVLLLQIVAVLGAYVFAFISEKKGNKFSLMLAVLIWMGVCVGGYLLQEEYQFFILAAVLGFVMGGVQSLSRSTYSKLIPETSKDTASFFSFYDITEKVAIVIGTFSYGFIEQLTGSMRNSLLAMIIFFILGAAFLATANMGFMRKGAKAVV
ncbi:MFS transporter [Flammeovirgaceae bacterium SG7u.111]|nr:MFS transporter [Flammeovirgaceae bacterium SG7u.132]WPO35223.1 MFS transporter [Flammeovirgaceae bacterium SG7u.111]